MANEIMPVPIWEAAKLTPEQRKEMEKEAIRKIKAGRVAMIRGPDRNGDGNHQQRPQDAFFSVLVMKLEPVRAWSVDTMATDGKKLYYNPAFTVQLPHEVIVGVLAHECMHPGMGHHARFDPQEGYDRELANLAMDAAINPLLIQDGYQLPEWAVVPGKPAPKDAPKDSVAHLMATFPSGKAAEVYYEMLKEHRDKIMQEIKERCKFLGGGDGEGGEGDGEGKKSKDVGGCGSVIFESDDAERSNSVQEWQQNIAEAALVAKSRGTLPAGLEQVVQDVLQPKVPWQQVLREYIRRYSRNDYSWSRPNRRYLAQDIYLPGVQSEELGDLVVAIDTSGSCCHKDTMERFFGELTGIIQGVRARVTLMECDCEVHRVRTWEASDGLHEPGRTYKGGGGTSHVPVWDEIRKRDIEPTVVVALTDGYTDFGDDPGYPVIWVIVDNEECKAPWGITINLDTKA